MPSIAKEATSGAVLSNPASLTLPRSTFAKVSPGPYLLAHLRPSDTSQRPTRPNGRWPEEFRTPGCTTSSLTHCAGSAVVRLGETAVVCGIQAEILLARDVANPPRFPPLDQISGSSDDEIRRRGHEELVALNLLVPNVDLATGCSPAHLPGQGGPPSAEAQALAQRLFDLLLVSEMVDVEDLRITYTPPATALDNDDEGMDDTTPQTAETIAYWVLYPSIHVLALSGSTSLFDAAWAAMRAAFADVKLPRAWWDPDQDTVLCSAATNEAKKLSLRVQPIACTWGIFTAKSAGDVRREEGHSHIKTKEGGDAWALADPDEFEDPLCSENITIVVDCSNSENTNILTIHKSGGGVVGREQMKNLLSAAETRWKEWDAVLP